ncbi:MAG: PilZ domain-containing protein [Spongiibacter sp.]
MNKQDQKRRYFRVPYPEAAKPPFEHDTGKTYKVVDISERGMKIDTAGDAELDIGMHVTGTVIFHDNTSVRVAGSVLRIDRDGAAIELANSLNVGNLLREQTFIRKKFPMFLMDKSRMG